MKISSIGVKNFKQFYGDQEVSVSTSDDQNITVFHGLNGTGKTSLFTAINWCLFGEGHEGMGDLLNRKVVSETNVGDPINLEVRVGFVHETVIYKAIRTMEYRKNENTPDFITSRFDLFSVDRQSQTIRVPNPEGAMNAILPKNVREYFFFNGEKMEDLTRPGNSKIQDAIKNIMHLPIIDRAVTHLDAVTRDYRTEISKLGRGRIETLIQEQENKENEKKRLKEDNLRLEREIVAANAQIKDLSQQLSDNREVGQLQNRRREIQEQIGRLKQNRDLIETRIQKTINDCFSVFITGEARKTLDLINSQVGKGKIPSGIREQFIKELLSQHLCICRRPINDGSCEHEALLDLLRMTAPNSLEETILRLRGQINTVSRVTTEKTDSVKTGTQDFFKILDELTSKMKEEDDLDRRIGGSEDIDIATIERRLQSTNQAVINFQITIERNKDKITEIDGSIAEIIKQREVEERAQVFLKKLSAREALARRATSSMQDIRDRFYEATRSRIEEETKLVFTQLAWKTDQFQDVKLDKDFHLEVIDRWGQPSREELGAGERQMLSLAFIAALSRLSGEEAPVIMDTPFARLSGNHLRTTTENLPKLLPQLILLVTDTEWTLQVSEGLRSRLGKEYTFDFVQGSTAIMED